MRNLKLGVVGGGIVGRATARAYVEHVAEVRVHDVDSRLATHSLEQVYGCDLIFVCLPTPQKKDSLECDLQSVESFLANTPNKQTNYVLRSTVPIGTTRRFREQYGLTNLVHSPEFLTSRCAVTDAQIPSRNIIGGEKETRKGESHQPTHDLYCLYEKRFPGVPIHVMTSDESEAVKLFQNGFFSVKIAYWNEMRCLADKLDLDWERVMVGILSDGRISYSHTLVPGPDGKRGFGGGCLEKDLANLIQCIYDTGLSSFVANAAYNRNISIDRYREEQP